MVFNPSTYANFVAQDSAARERLIQQYRGSRSDFDIIVVGSGMGGGVLADDLADRLGEHKRILVLEAGSFLYPTHVYNATRFLNSDVAKHFACDTFWQAGNSGSQNYIGEAPQLNFGGRSIWWSGLIPTPQAWELDYFPPNVRTALTTGGLLDRAGEVMNESRSMGTVAAAVVGKLQASPLNTHFDIRQTPRALHQPYLRPDGTPQDRFFTEPTGVFNTAELLINQLGLTRPNIDHNGPGLHVLLNHYVEDVQDHGSHLTLLGRNALTGEARWVTAAKVVLAAGSIGSPKLLRRSSLYPGLPDSVKGLVGRGLTDHPTTSKLSATVTGIDGQALASDDHAKIVFYSRGVREGGRIKYPFNVEMNLNHEKWHLRENDPASPPATGQAKLDIKFSFANCLDENNEVRTPPPFGYVPEIAFRNQSWADYLSGSRLPTLAGWNLSTGQVWDVLNEVALAIFARFNRNGVAAVPDGGARMGQGGQGFGWGTVHHAAGSLRMPYRPHLDAPFAGSSVVDENLKVVGTDRLFVCDMSVLPLSPAANPVRPLVALALRLSRHLG